MIVLTKSKIESANKSVCFWSWNNEITEEGIIEQLRSFAVDRIGGVVIHARAGLKIPYMGKRWMELFKYAVEQADELGLEVWIYDEDGWPSGFAAGKIPLIGDEYCFKRLLYGYITDFEVASISADDIIAIYIKNDNNTYLRVKDCDLDSLPADSFIFWKTTDRNYVDLLNPDVTKQFINNVHNVYKEYMGEYFGKAIKGFFTDEPQMNTTGYARSITLADTYYEKYGEELLEKLWLIAVDGDEANKFRYELWTLICKLYFENFVTPLAEWCGQNNLALTGHFPCEDGLTNQLPACGNLMKNYSVMQLPAIDHLGSRVASPVLMKQASSVSRQFGDGNVMSETFGCAGWAVDFKQLEWIWGGQSVLGITKPCYHLSAFSIEGRRKRDYPAFYSYQEPWWDDFSSFAKWMSRFNELMTSGKRDLHTIVIPPNTELKANYIDENHDNSNIRNISSDFRLLLENLLDLQVDFDLGNEDLLLSNFEIDEGNLILGNIKYDTVILSSERIITKEMYEFLKKLSNNGIRIFIMDRFPEKFIDGTVCDFSSVNGVILQNRRDTMAKYMEYFEVCRKVTVLRPDNLKIVSGLRIHTRKTWKGRTVHIWPGENFATQNVLLSFKTEAIPYEIDLLTGERRKITRINSNGRFLAPITVKAGENLVIELINGSEMNDVEFVLSEKKHLNDMQISLKEKNNLTLDYASLSVDNGKSFGEPKPVILLLNEIYSNDRVGNLDIILRYEFYIDENVDTTGFELAFEDTNAKKVVINGKELKQSRNTWWIDKCIGTYSIDEFIKHKENIIDLHYTVPPIKNEKEVLDAFETEKNRFFYPVEPENIYIRGNFDVVIEGDYKNNGFCYQTGEKFKITYPSQKEIGDLTTQNMWFYRGNCSYKFEFEALDTGKTVITVEDYSGTMLALNIGDARIISHDKPASFDITDYVKKGINTADLELIGHNRNLLGPHHYIGGESFMVCPATYEGRWECLPEFMAPNLFGKSTWTDDYGFVPFGIKSVYLNRFTEERE